MKRSGIWFRETKGMTMVEVTVAFLILTMVLAAFSQVAVLTSRMVWHSERQLQENRSLAGACYLDGNRDPEPGKAEAVSPLIESVVLHFQAESGQAFEIPANVRKFSGPAGNLYDVITVE